LARVSNRRRRAGDALGRAIFVIALGLGLATSPSQANETMANRTGLFGTEEVRTVNLTPFPKWTGTLVRFRSETGDGEACGNDRLTRCEHARWQTFIDHLREKSPIEQIRAVNREMNRHRYILDPVNYGVADYWATPFQFLRLDGDCEDYAIAKFMALRALGFDNDALRIVVLRDLNLKLAHAILVVYHEGRILVLDNQIPDIVEASVIRHYRPIYSVNETAWWLHRP
jgi:predicted transglutaminase-like cysteine proteinase